MALQHLRSSTAHKRPIPTVMSAGQLAINTNEGSPGLFFKDSNGDLVKVGPVHIGTSAPNSSPDSLAATALVTGTVYQILTVGNSDFTLVGASANTVGTVFTATGTTTGTGTVSGQQGNEKGEQWLDTTGSAFDLKIYDGTAWRSQAGEFVNVTGDTMTGAFGVVAGTASAPGVFFSGDTNTGLLSPGGDSVAVTTGGTQRVVVDAGGNVAIGATSASSKFHVNVGTNQNIAFNSDGSNSRISAFNDAANASVPLVINGSELKFTKSGSDAMLIDSSGRLLVGLSSSIDSGSKLQVEGRNTITAIRYSAAVGNAGSKIELSRSASNTIGTTAAVSATDELGEIRFRGATSSSSFNTGARIAAKVESGTISSSSLPTCLSFSTTANNSSSQTERLRIDSSGRVGIGETSPSANLIVKQSGSTFTAQSQTVALFQRSSTTGHGAKIAIIAGNAASSDINFGDTDDEDAGLIQYVHANNSFKFTTNAGSSPAMLIDSSGNVGIGTTAPGTKLDVRGDVSIAYNATHALRFYNEGRTNWSSITNTIASPATTANLVFKSGSGTMVMTHGGNVGIGTTTPGSLLELSSAATSAVGGLTLANTNAAGFSTIQFKNTGSSGRTYTLALGGNTSPFPGSVYLYDDTAGAARLVVDSSGNVGIGTTNVQKPLHIRKDGESYPLLVQNRTNSTSTAGIAFIATGSDFGDGRYASIEALSGGTGNTLHNLLFRTCTSGGTPTEQMRITSSGFVGIGTTAPETRLHVKSNSTSNVEPLVLIENDTGTGGDVSLRLEGGGSNNNPEEVYIEFCDRSDSGNSFAIGLDDNAQNLHLGHAAKGSMNNHTQFTLNSSGNVGIGNTDPGTLLQVADSSDNGAIRVGGNNAGATGLTLSYSNSGNTTTTILQNYRQSSDDALLKLDAGYLTFHTSTSGTERMRITQSGYLCASTNISDSDRYNQSYHALTSSNGNAIAFAVENSSSDPFGMFIDFSDAAPDNHGNYFFQCADSSTSRMFIYADGDVVNHDNSYGAISDVKLKQDIVDSGSQWNDLKSLRVRKFKFKSDVEAYGDEAKTLIGLVAQEAELVSPGLVRESPDTDADNNDLGTTTKSVNYSVLYMKAVKALQEAMDRIETLETKVAQLEAG